MTNTSQRRFRHRCDYQPCGTPTQLERQIRQCLDRITETIMPALAGDQQGSRWHHHGLLPRKHRIEQRAGGPAMLSDHERDDRTGQQPGQDRVLELGPDMHSYPPAPRVGHRGERPDGLLRNPRPFGNACSDADLAAARYKMHRSAFRMRKGRDIPAAEVQS